MLRYTYIYKLYRTELVRYFAIGCSLWTGEGNKVYSVKGPRVENCFIVCIVFFGDNINCKFVCLFNSS